MHPSTEAILRHFEYDHLPPALGVVSKAFHDLAWALVSDEVTSYKHHDLPTMSGPETTTALRKLLEAKDCAVRAARFEVAR